MTRATDRDDFFVGWSGRTGRPLGNFLVSLAAALLVGFLALAATLSAVSDDPGPGRYDYQSGDQVLHGVLTIDPYPLLRLPPDANHKDGHTILLSGDGKQGAPVDAATMGNRRVEVSGYMLQRGSIDMLQVNSVAPMPSGEAVESAVAPAQSLGRWRITGEICDGKCYSGAMRPGAGLAHKACANLCLIGEIPPVFVSTAPLAGAGFLLLADQAGHKLPDAMRDYVALRLRLEGEVERRGDVLVFKVDIARAVILR